MDPITVYVGFGSNQGDLVLNFETAKRHLLDTPGLSGLNASRLYHTEPLVADGSFQAWYLNAVFSLQTTLTLHRLFSVLHDIEKKMGRVRKKKWASRIVDLDILFYGDLVFSDNEISVPHRAVCQRAFVLKPLSDLAPGMVHPEMQMTVAELLADCESPLAIHLFDTCPTGTES